MAACRRSCLPGGPARRCQQSALFGACERADMKRPLWFFNGTHCFEWRYPLGQCPAPDPPAFRSRRECRKLCPVQRRRCRPPEATEHCSARLLRYPVFAASTPGVGMACLRVGPASLLPYRCLRGANRFRSAKDCERLCARDRTD
ncbi:uncharacterized protein [Dermacentor andersoni]|uniref:uncharacterized protein n=1 Tax=Dermacentor andersoni TaxID=34620 RepID=UPI002417AD5D|nr:uncharacterized protein LOC129383077 [Dermacentor andersoni]